MSRPNAYAGMPGGNRKGRNVQPTRDQFREMHRLLALFWVTTREISQRIGWHLPVSLLDRFNTATQFRVTQELRSKLDDWACLSEANSSAVRVFYGQTACLAHAEAERIVAAFLADESETLPPGFMEGK